MLGYLAEHGGYDLRRDGREGAYAARVLRLVDPDDSVVRPEEGLIVSPGESVLELQVPTQVRRPGSLGHGAILDEPAVWRRVLAAIGPQRRGAESHVADPIDNE